MTRAQPWSARGHRGTCGGSNTHTEPCVGEQGRGGRWPSPRRSPVAGRAAAPPGSHDGLRLWTFVGSCYAGSWRKHREVTNGPRVTKSLEGHGNGGDVASRRWWEWSNQSPGQRCLSEPSGCHSSPGFLSAHFCPPDTFSLVLWVLPFFFFNQELNYFIFHQ